MRLSIRSLYMSFFFPIYLTAVQHAPEVEAQQMGQDVKVVVFYTNGILDSPADSLTAIRELKLAIDNVVGSADLTNVDYAIAYNSTSGGWDILEAAVQDKLTDEAELWSWVGEYVPMPAWCQELVKQIEARFYQIGYMTNGDVQKQVREYVKNINTERKSIIVPHSQGNCFANIEFGILSDRQREAVRIVAAASPDSFVAGGGEYTTLEEDKVILAVRAAKMLLGGPGPLPANLTNGPSGGSEGVLHHAFVATYLEQSSKSRSRIAAGISAALAH
jgi:hypothetical protein